MYMWLQLYIVYLNAMREWNIMYIYIYVYVYMYIFIVFMLQDSYVYHV